MLLSYVLYGFEAYLLMDFCYIVFIRCWATDTGDLHQFPLHPFFDGEVGDIAGCPWNRAGCAPRRRTPCSWRTNASQASCPTSPEDRGGDCTLPWTTARGPWWASPGGPWTRPSRSHFHQCGFEWLLSPRTFCYASLSCAFNGPQITTAL